MKILKYQGVTKPVTEMIGIGAGDRPRAGGGRLPGVESPRAPAGSADQRSAHAARTDGLLRPAAGISDPARKFAEIYNQLQRAMAAADRIYTMLDREPTIIDPPRPLPIPRPTGNWSSITSWAFTITPGTPADRHLVDCRAWRGPGHRPAERLWQDLAHEPDPAFLQTPVRACAIG